MSVQEFDRVRAVAPGRVNLIGEHTDYTGGLVLPMAIDRATRIDAALSERFDLVSDADDVPARFSVGADPGSVTGWGRYVAAVAAEMGVDHGLTGTLASDLPVGAGLSSSASLEVGVALALGHDGEVVELARLGQRAEHRATGVPTGIMDQLSIAAGRAGHATLIDCGSLDITYVAIPDAVQVVVRFVAHRTLVGSEYADRHDECMRAEAEIGSLATATLADVVAIGDPIVRRRARHVVTENARVREFASALAAGDALAAGAIMTDGHRSLRDDFECSTPQMDAAVDELLATPGVYGARMTGGGFGGCVVALCAPDAEVDGWAVQAVDGARRR